MHGELYPVWSELIREVWIPLNELEGAPEDLFAELYREFANPPVAPTEPKPAADAFDIVGNLARAEDLAAEEAYKEALVVFDAKRAAYDEAIAGTGSPDLLHRLLQETVSTELASIAVLEKIRSLIEALEVESLHNAYFVLMERFISKYSLRYDLRRPFSLQPTLSGIFGSLLKDLRVVALEDAHLLGLLNDFDDSLRDLKAGTSAGRIKTCLQKQFNLAEALGQKCPGVTANTLGDICGQLNVWPHVTVREALRKLYGFRSAYPGLGHAGNPVGVLREVEMRDLVAVSVLLAGFVPYLSHQVNSDLVYRGA